MSEAILKKITYGQLVEDTWLTDDDRYGIASFVDANVRETFSQNPNNTDASKTAVLLIVNDGIVVGRSLLY